MAREHIQTNPVPGRKTVPYKQQSLSVLTLDTGVQFQTVNQLNGLLAVNNFQPILVRAYK